MENGVRMSRKTRRIFQRQSKKAKYSLQDVQAAIAIAIEMKKHSKGHLFSTQLQERCVFCGQDMKTKKQCEYWAMTLIDRIQTVLINPTFFTDENVEALYLQHGEQYQNIKLPLISQTIKKQKEKPIKPTDYKL